MPQCILYLKKQGNIWFIVLIGNMLRAICFLVLAFLLVSMAGKPVPVRSGYPMLSYSQDSGVFNGIRYTFIESDTFYAIKAVFYSKTELECLCNVSYLLKH